MATVVLLICVSNLIYCSAGVPEVFQVFCWKLPPQRYSGRNLRIFS